MAVRNGNRRNRFQLQQRKFRLEPRKNFLSLKERCLSIGTGYKIVKSLSLENFQTRLDTGWGGLVDLR